tara:strand:- start:103 stop:411 length:309 start_codon:yes stop_codon:yes gene_type:complete
MNWFEPLKGKSGAARAESTFRGQPKKQEDVEQIEPTKAFMRTIGRGTIRTLLEAGAFGNKFEDADGYERLLQMWKDSRAEEDAEERRKANVVHREKRRQGDY